MYNRIILIGRVTAPPQMRYTPTGKAVCSFSLAVNRRRGGSQDSGSQGQQDVDFINIVAWEKLADICSRYLEKGKLVCVEGRLQIRSYTGNDGIQRKAAEVVANDMQMLSPKNAPAGNVPSESGSFGTGENFGQADPSDFGMNDDLPF